MQRISYKVKCGMILLLALVSILSFAILTIIKIRPSDFGIEEATSIEINGTVWNIRNGSAALGQKITDKISIDEMQNLEEEYGAIRAGRANPRILDRIQVDYYGTPTSLQGVANISVPEARMIQIQPWDAGLIKDIEKAILASDLGLTPANDGKVIRLVFPELTEERRKELAKDIKKKGEGAKVAVRNIRRDAMVKFSYVSPIGTAGLYYNATAVDFQQEGEKREMICELMREIVNLSHAMGIEFEEDLVERNLKILSNLAPESTTSMQRDVMAGKQSEIDGLVYEVVRMGREYGVPMSEYEKAAVQFQKQGL